MKIIDIRTIQLSYRAANPSMSAASFNAARNALIVEVETDAVGVKLCAAPLMRLLHDS